MPKSRLSVPAVALVILVLSLAVAGPAVADQASGSSRPRIVLTALTAPARNSVAESLASTITSSIDLVLRLTGSVSVERADFLTPTFSFGHALEYYQQVHAEGAVFGSVTPDARGGYAVDLEVWNGARPSEKPAAISRTISNLLSSFEVADALSLRVASTIVGRRLTEGTLVVKNVTSLPSYSVYADGQLLGRNQTQFRVLTGEREVIVAKPGPIGDIPVETFHVDIKEGQTSTVALAARSPASMAERPSSVPSTATASVRALSAGALFVDGVRWGALSAGETVTVTGLALGAHEFQMRYADGHVENASATFTPRLQSAFISLTYVPTPAASSESSLPEKTGNKQVSTTPGGLRYVSLLYNPFGGDSNGNSVTSYSLVMAGYGQRGGFLGVELQYYNTPQASQFTLTGNLPAADPGFALLGMSGIGGGFFKLVYIDFDALYGVVTNRTSGAIDFMAGLTLGTSVRLGPVVLRVDIPALFTFPLGNGMEMTGVDFGGGVSF